MTKTIRDQLRTSFRLHAGIRFLKNKYETRMNKYCKHVMFIVNYAFYRRLNSYIKYDTEVVVLKRYVELEQKKKKLYPILKLR